MQLKLTQIRNGVRAPLIRGSSLILHAAIKKTVSLVSNQTAYIPTGFEVELPKDHIGLIAQVAENWRDDRRLLVQNIVHFGTDKLGELLVVVHNMAPTVDKIKSDEPIGQLLILPRPTSIEIVGIEDQKELAELVERSSKEIPNSESISDAKKGPASKPGTAKKAAKKVTKKS